MLSTGAFAQGFTDSPRLPRPRPPVETKADVELWADNLQARFRAAGAELEDVPAVQQPIAADGSAFVATRRIARLPHARPAHASAPLAVTAPEAAAEMPRAPVAPLAPLAPLAPRVAEPEDTACLARLDALGATYAKEAPIDSDGPCFVDHPLMVTSVGSGVAIAPGAILNCRTAESLALWTRDVLVPSARDILGATPTKIVHGSSYVCRTRDDRPGAKLSEHAHANAVDIASILFAEREPFNVENRDMTSTEGRFQVTIRKGSCGYFTTVLGPRSDAAHATHFHFDMAERRGGYRLCDLADTNFVGAVAP
jgi:hypothetical protein